ncbi:MAG: hypothetical protein PHU85_07585 [Phycisphaerae bacterium]|nr:hypothetical protein [Phycisphaerae bacterium]
MTHRQRGTATPAADSVDSGCDPAARPRGWGRTLAAAVVGALCSIAIWIATPYNNYLFLNVPLADDYLPAGAVFFILVIVLAINPLLRRLRQAWALTGRQLAIVFAVMLVASSIPGHGLLRSLPYMLAETPRIVNQNKALADEYGKMHVPPSLFPDKVKYGLPAPVGEAFSNGKPGAEVAWAPWMRPLATWGLLLLFAWMMMMGLSVIVLPQWRDNERLAFPLVTVERAIIEDPAPGKSYPPLLRCRSFWAGAGVVFLLHVLAGLKIYFPEGVPAIPLNWNFGSMFSEPPWQHLPIHLSRGRIFFAFVGLAFFMPGRIAFSIWFFILFYGGYRMVGISYLPPFHHGQMADHRSGAMLAMTAAVLWMGRAHWRRVAGCLFRKPAGDEDRRNRDSAWLMILGMAGLWAWLTWLGWGFSQASPAPDASLARHAAWALALVAYAFMIALLISRVVAETGMPFMRLQSDAGYLMKLAPMSWLTPVTMYMAAIVTIIFPIGSRVGPSAMAVQGLALSGENRPKSQMRLGWLFLAVLVGGLLIGGWSHIEMNYQHDSAIDGSPINGFGKGGLGNANKVVDEIRQGDLSRPPQNVGGHFLFGTTLAGLLYWLSLTFPTWPLHPIGLLVIDSPSYGDVVWASIFIGWLAKVVLVRFGGAMGYRKARLVFLGLIMGEVFAAIFWAGVQLLLVSQGILPRQIRVLPGT